MFRIVLLLCIASISGCITLVVHSGEGKYPNIGSSEAGADAVRNAQRESQNRLLRLKQENLDALIVMGVRIASDAQAWSLKPAAFRGAALGETIADAHFAALGYPTARSGVFLTLDGQYSIEHDNAALKIVGVNHQWSNRIEVLVDGVLPSDIRLRVVSE